MNMLVKQSTYQQLASEDEQVAALVLLNALPSREADATSNKAAYFIALESVELYGLQRATADFLKGKVGRGFFPSPAELRMQCEAVMQPIRDTHRKVQEQARQNLEAREFAAIKHSPAAKARVAAIYQRFCDGNHREGKSEAQELAEIRAKYDPSMLAAVPDAPVSLGGLRQLGGKPKP
ncbi:hypothetical protein [Phyllobacterium sp. P5_D12]